jgi:signal transduction histidine kinase
LNKKSPSILIFSILFGYIILQFLWWEVLLVRQTGQIIAEKQKLAELSSTNAEIIKTEVELLHAKKTKQTVMIVGEGTVFLLLLLFGIFKIRQALTKELELTIQQKNFLLSITHELKTPIAATKLQLQTLQKHKLDETKQQELIGNALLETERLNNLIDNVLIASRLDSGEFLFKKENENISTLIETILNRYYKNEIAKKELLISLEKDVFLPIDKTIFPSIIINLIDNAFKYSFNEKVINLSLKKTNTITQIEVSDLGCGISDTDKKKIFTKFYRAGDEETRNSKGTGLGLYIVNYLVKNHNGKILVKDNFPKGTTFEITF